MIMYKVSVIVPVYNREKTILRCIESIMNQTSPVHEIIAVDDGSSDNSIQILSKIECDYLIVLKQNHKGAQAARNLGIMKSTGNYIAFLDSDDEWMPNALESLLKGVAKNEDSVVYADCYIDKSGERETWNLPGKSGNIYESLLLKPAPMFQALLVKKDFFVDLNYLDENAPSYQEWETCIRLSKNHTFIHLNEPLFVYYLHEGETISKNPAKDVKGYSYIVRKHLSETISHLGFSGACYHYRVILLKCFHYRNYRCLIYIWPFLYYQLLSFLNGEKKRI